MVIQDEARHVHYGVLALREHFATELSERERREREDWAFEVALLMRNRFMAYEVYEEWFEHAQPRAVAHFVTRPPGMERVPPGHVQPAGPQPARDRPARRPGPGRTTPRSG
jgi:hypothetical protein